MSASKQRQPGWYWVIVDDEMPDFYECAHWNGRVWSVIGTRLTPDSVHKIIGRIPTPDEPWQCVPVEATPEILEASGHGSSHEAGASWQDMLAAAPKPEDAP